MTVCAKLWLSCQIKVTQIYTHAKWLKAKGLMFTLSFTGWFKWIYIVPYASNIHQYLELSRDHTLLLCLCPCLSFVSIIVVCITWLAEAYYTITMRHNVISAIIRSGPAATCSWATLLLSRRQTNWTRLTHRGANTEVSAWLVSFSFPRLQVKRKGEWKGAIIWKSTC